MKIEWPDIPFGAGFTLSPAAQEAIETEVRTMAACAFHSHARSTRAQRCRVYWGSHGCDLERGHPGGPDSHDCDCCECASHPDPDSGCVARAPYYGPETRFYGDDAEALGLPLV